MSVHQNQGRHLPFFRRRVTVERFNRSMKTLHERLQRLERRIIEGRPATMEEIREAIGDELRSKDCASSFECGFLGGVIGALLVLLAGSLLRFILF